MEIVLFEPEIPQNTGNVARTCVAVQSKLTLVEPLGFSISSRKMKRAGLDYWEKLEVKKISDLDHYLHAQKNPFYFFSSKASKLYTEIPFSKNDLYIFGNETSGLPKHYLEKYPDLFYTLPQSHNVRCLNLSNAVAIILYKSWETRQFN
jgi:tRNA (cytidine/uridine-2'-O-)-methyltransferase